MDLQKTHANVTIRHDERDLNQKGVNLFTEALSWPHPKPSADMRTLRHRNMLQIVHVIISSSCSDGNDSFPSPTVHFAT